MVVHTEDARSYAKYLEERDEIVSYDVCVPLDPGALDRVDKVDIRGDYFRQQWESDFQLIYVDGAYIPGRRNIHSVLWRKAQIIRPSGMTGDDHDRNVLAEAICAISFEL